VPRAASRALTAAALFLVEQQEAQTLTADLPPMANLFRDYHRGRSIGAGPVTSDVWTGEHRL
jgi:hypothetical protein